MLIFNIILFVSLIKLLIETDQPFLCSGLYTVIRVVLMLIFGHHALMPLLISSVIIFGLSSLYFWLLNRFSEGILWWLIMIIGMPICLV